MADDTLQLFSNRTADWFQSCVGAPTRVQQEAWPVIASGRDVLVSAPTGTGKTLSAFLVFIDQMKKEAEKGSLKPELQLIYVSPLKSLAGDIRENLKRPLNGIPAQEGEMVIETAIRTGDTSQSERRSMIKHPPHILITTPESLYLMLTSRSGQGILKTARAIVIDELHALIDTKRGAHLMFSMARLDKLCGRNLQRIGLSATIEPLRTAADYLSPDGAVIVSPSMNKEIRIEVTGPMPMFGERRRSPVWEDVARAVYEQCMGCRSVIAFTEARRYAEKLSYYVNQIAGEGFARVHHGSLSKEQRDETEEALREGRLKLLCATSSMELGIDVGDIDQVLQIGCPRTVSGTMQRLGRAGHNPGRASVMYMYPRTAPECLSCGMTAQVAREGGVEYARPPRLCLDILSQHLVSMAVDEGYGVDDVLELTKRAYPFREVTKEDVRDVLSMLAGDFEHSQDIPVRPRVLYDRIHETVMGDAYSRMLAVHGGGTIPDKGLYTVKNEEGVKLGELDEEFVYESRLGDTFLLGSFAWRIVRQDRDMVVVEQAPADGARIPFWKGELKGRSLRTSLKFGAIMRHLGEAAEENQLETALSKLGLDEAAATTTAEFIKRQLAATGVLPDDRTILVEHFTDKNGSHQVMVHAPFGRQVNTPLSLLVQRAGRKNGGYHMGCVDEDNGFLLYPYGKESLPEGLLFQLQEEGIKETLEAMLLETPVFGMNFRYNSARALMMGIKLGGRQPLWMQRLRSTQMLDALLKENSRHPLIRETKRECLEENWDIDGLLDIMDKIRSGKIVVHEIYTDVASPLSLPLQWQVEAAEMYEYSPVTPGIRQAVNDELRYLETVKPAPLELERVSQRYKLPEDEQQLHTLLMTEGDLVAGELDVPVQWMKSLAEQGRALYVEPGLWIAAEHREEYEQSVGQDEGQSDGQNSEEALCHIIRRMLRYRGAKSLEEIETRYMADSTLTESAVKALCADGSLIEEEGLYYHAKLYDRAVKATVRGLRQQAVTQPPQCYASMMAGHLDGGVSSEDQLSHVMERFCGKRMPAAFWESILLPGRVKRYRENLLDRLLAQGDYFWTMWPDDTLSFHRYEEIDWDFNLSEKPDGLNEEEELLYRELKRRGASFLTSLNGLLKDGDAQKVLLSLARKGLVCADSFVPVRQYLNQDKVKKATVRQRVNVRVMALSAGRWDVVRPVKEKGMEALLEQLLKEHVILSRETFRESAPFYEGFLPKEAQTWTKALELLGIWEYTGRIRRGYFIKGMSGAQFIRKQDLPLLSSGREEEQEIRWLHAADPAQVWGKVLQHMEGRNFTNINGTAVALRGGVPIAVMERQGKTLRLLYDPEGENTLEEDDGKLNIPEDDIMGPFVRAFHNGMLFPSQKRLIVKEYPKQMCSSLIKAGFCREMQDYVLYR